MENIVESFVVGYLSGVLVGSLILVFVVGWILIENDVVGVPEWYSGLVEWAKEFRTANPTAFEIAFVLGFLSGIGGSGSAANSQRKKN